MDNIKNSRRGLAWSAAIIIAGVAVVLAVVVNPWSASEPEDSSGSKPLDSEQIEYQPTNQGVLSPTEIDEIIGEAAALNGIVDQGERREWVKYLRPLIDKESGGNSDAVAARGEHPVAADGESAQSPRGLVALTPRVFGEYHRAGTSMNIYDPVANVAAAIGFINSRRGGVPVGEFLAGYVS